MRKIFFVLFVLYSFISYSQINGKVTFDWRVDKEISVGDRTIIAPSFVENGFGYDFEKRLVYFQYKVEDFGINSNATLEITDLVFEPISIDQLVDIDIKKIPTSLKYSLIFNNSRDKEDVFIELFPIIKDTYGFKKVKSFTYNIKVSNSAAKIAKSKKVNSIVDSVLSSGDWFQFYIEKSGVYKISYSFLQQLGLNLSQVDPKKIKLFGNGGRMLPLANIIDYPIDLTENAIQIIGEADGKFDTDDYILFYGEGTDTWNEESNTNVNLYDTKSYFYITVQGSDGKRISNIVEPTGNSTINLTTFDDHQFHEVDLVNLGRLGRTWYGEVFDIKQDQDFLFNFPNIDLSTPVKIEINTASTASTSTFFRISSNDRDLGSISFPALTSSSGVLFFERSFELDNLIPTNDSFKIKLLYNNGGVPGSKGYLNNILISAKRKLQGYGKQFNFQYDLSQTSSGIVTYNLSNTNGISQIWDVTNIYDVKNLENKNQSTISFKADLGVLRKYVAVDALDYYTPLKTSVTKIPNQNIKGTVFKNQNGEFQDIDYVIITPAFLSNSAEKLANFHRNYSKLNVKVLQLETIYQEFSSGKQDIAAIRNCIKYIYQNASTAEKRLKYVNLFGDASFDYKNKIANNTNIVPIYHSMVSNNTGESSYSSDDFFGLMDDNEGNISRFGGIDIAVGRMIHDNASQANEIVNKIIEYHDEKAFGNWRNNIVMISDDSDKTSDVSLQRRQNALSDQISIEKPFLNVNKILLDSYPQESSAGGNRYPKARADFLTAFEKGSLVINYLGHGGEDGLANERLWEKLDGVNLNNQYKYPLFITITCDFSKFDNPLKPTAGEFTYWNPKGGAISMISTIRAIGQLTAENFNDVFARNLFSYGSNNYPSIAEALRISKNANPNSSTNVVFYIGDPALKLAIPQPKVILTKVNDVAINQSVDDFKALSKMKITGEVVDQNNNLLSNYNGELFTSIFDKFVTRSTNNNDGNSPAISFNTLGETIFRGKATVTNGQFEFNFIVPKDIRVPIANGKISFYSKKNQTFENQAGYNTDIKVGGINENAIDDKLSPRLKLFINDNTFISGGTTNQSPILIAEFEDESGINTASGIGHDILAILDGDINNPIILNEYFETKLDDFTKGSLRYSFNDLSLGLHTLSFRAWDVYNNPVTAEIQFMVVADESITLTNVLNYPNPFVNYTEFWFTHNRPFEPLEVQVQVMSITGKMVWSKSQMVTTEGFLSKEITWNGKDDFGNKIGKGVYIYKLTVKSNLNNSKAEKFEKLVIL